MTMTVKLDEPLERALRKRCATLGRSASALMREALQAYLAQTAPPALSAFALGEDLFGKHAGPADLSSQSRAALQQIWDQKHPAGPAPVAPSRHGKT